MRTILLPIFTLLFCLSHSSIASAQQYYNVDLDILGYSPKTKNVYVFESKVHSNSEQHIYAHNLKDKELKQPLGTAKYLEIHDAKHFSQTQMTLKKELKKLQPLDFNTLKIDVLAQTSSQHDNTAQFSTIYTTQFMISTEKFQTTPQNLIHYSTDIKLKQAYLLPDNKGIIATFSSLAYPFDSGFYREESVLLIPKTTFKTVVLK